MSHDRPSSASRSRPRRAAVTLVLLSAVGLAAAEINHFETYNRTPAAQRVADIVTGASQAPTSKSALALGDVDTASQVVAALGGPKQPRGRP